MNLASEPSAAARLFEERGHGHHGLRPHDVVHSSPTVFVEMNHELGEVAHVDELHGVVAPAGGQHLTAASQALGPVGESVGRIAGTDDIGGTHDHAVVAEGVLHKPLASRLGDTECRGFILGIVRVEAYRRCVSSSPRKIGVIDAGRGCEEVTADVSLQERRRQTDPVGIGRRVIHDGIPFLPLQRFQVPVAVSFQSDDAGGEVGVAAAAQ